MTYKISIKSNDCENISYKIVTLSSIRVKIATPVCQEMFPLVRWILTKHIQEEAAFRAGLLKNLLSEFSDESGKLPVGHQTGHPYALPIPPGNIAGRADTQAGPGKPTAHV